MAVFHPRKRIFQQRHGRSISYLLPLSFLIVCTASSSAIAQGTDVQRMIDNNNRKLDDLSRSQTYQRERILDNTSIRRQLENSRDNEAIGRPRLPNCPPNAAEC